MTEFIHGGPPRFQHQLAGLRKMIATKGVTALLYEPGTGKSAVVVDFACLLALKSLTGEARVLVVAPLAATDTWVLQFQAFASPQVSWWAEVLGGTMLEKQDALAARGGNPWRTPRVPPEKRRKRLGTYHPRALYHQLASAWAAGGYEREEPVRSWEGPGYDDPYPGQENETWQQINRKPRVVVEIINLDVLGRRDELGSRTMADQFVEAIKRYAPDLIVLDESHLIRGPSSNASRLMARAGKTTTRRINLTGTVMPTSPRDVFSQWRFLSPTTFGQIDANGVRQVATLADYDERYVVMGHGYWGVEEIKGYQRLDELQERLAENAVVALKKDCLDLPPATPVEVPFSLSPQEDRLYRQLKKNRETVLPSGQELAISSPLTLGMRLRQITAGYLPTSDPMQPHESIGKSKLNVISGIVNGTLEQEKRVVVFALFDREIEQLSALLAVKGTELMVISGKTGTSERMDMRRRFGDLAAHPGRMVMIAQIQTMSVSVNELVSASHAVYASLSLMRDEIVQSMARLDRIGQTRPVTFWIPLAKKTVDEVIWKAHQTRTNMETMILQHINQS